MVGFFVPKVLWRTSHTLVLSAHSYNLHSKNLQNPLTLVMFVTLSTVVVPADREEEKKHKPGTKVLGECFRGGYQVVRRRNGVNLKNKDNRDRL